ncbi:MAG: AMP-binding protein [Proteobacteria bacterium]|nr:AMP-binding protein [Pseudomonadota bacterium]
MTFIADHARERPDHPALIDAATGEALSYRELNDRSNRLAQLLHARGLRRGDHIALFMENNPRFLEVCWAAARSGLFYTTINRYLTAEEAAYIVNDCGARVLMTSHARAEAAGTLGGLIPDCPIRMMTDGTIPGWEPYEDAVASHPAAPLGKEWLGEPMLYSSGTTGRPKGIKRALLDLTVGQDMRWSEVQRGYGFGPDSVYLSPAPLYHAAPISYSMIVQRLGGTVVMMRRFDALEALRLIDRYRVTHSQWVPTMFVRMLKLPKQERESFDLSSHRVAIHAAAPCPVEIKREMIRWWGPIIHEYYGATERIGVTQLDSREWLAHPGSVGKAILGILHICDDEGAELPHGESGLIYFERDVTPFAYHNDPQKTDAARHPAHRDWWTTGDIGYVDAEGYLYLTDRKAFMIISGGVNIYPREIEDALVLHPKVRDAAVFGVPNDEMGEEVKAVIEPMPDADPSPALAEELIAFLGRKIARYMVPRTIDFMEELPRLPTGKLYKKALRDEYWKAAGR